MNAILQALPSSHDSLMTIDNEGHMTNDNGLTCQENRSMLDKTQQ